MFVALDTHQKVAVTGLEVQATTDYNRKNSTADETRYRCICCDAPLACTDEEATTPIEWFTHEHGHQECISDGNMSMEHRLGQELVAMTLFNLLPTDRETTQIDLERRIGVNSEFLIADVRVTRPIQLAVEVMNLNPDLSLRRRLQTLFREGYAGMVVVVTSGELSPTRIERHLKKIGMIRVGRFNPQTLSLEFGSVVTPDRINLETPVWNRVPAYLS